MRYLAITAALVVYAVACYALIWAGSHRRDAEEEDERCLGT